MRHGSSGLLEKGGLDSKCKLSVGTAALQQAFTAAFLRSVGLGTKGDPRY